MSGGKHFVNSETKIDWWKHMANDFVVINDGEKFINKKSISEIRLVKFYKEFIELAEWQRIKLSDFEHLKPPKPPALEQFNPLPQDNGYTD